MSRSSHRPAMYRTYSLGRWVGELHWKRATRRAERKQAVEVWRSFLPNRRRDPLTVQHFRGTLLGADDHPSAWRADNGVTVATGPGRLP